MKLNKEEIKTQQKIQKLILTPLLVIMKMKKNRKKQKKENK